MQTLPLIASFLIAMVIAPPAIKALAAGPLARENYRGLLLACPLGVVILATAVVALVPLALLQQLTQDVVLRPELGWIAIYVLGVAALGLLDDALSDGARGWRGHAGTVMRSEFSTGALKAVGAAGLALYVMSERGLSTWHFLLGSAVLVLSTNLFNLLDLRPGRAIKAFVVLGIALTLGASDLHPLWALGLFAGPVLAVGLYDIREAGLLGDTGANMVGALAGAWLVLTLSPTAQLVAVLLLAALTAYGEFRSISDVIDRTPGLRELDSWGRLRNATDA